MATDVTGEKCEPRFEGSVITSAQASDSTVEPVLSRPWPFLQREHMIHMSPKAELLSLVGPVFDSRQVGLYTRS